MPSCSKVILIISLFLECSMAIPEYQQVTDPELTKSQLELTTQQQPQLTTLLQETKPQKQQQDTELVQLQHCNCTRKMHTKNNRNGFYNYRNTTCSRDAYQRGGGQNVVSFCYYSHDAEYTKAKGYFEGIRANLELIAKHYPGWIMRLYFDKKSSDNHTMTHLCLMACRCSHLDLCDVGDLPGMPMVDARKTFSMIWRFFPTLDPQVDTFLSRDLDSRIMEREVAAVEEWLTLGEPIHCMRDHPQHWGAFLGGCWGADLTKKNSRKNWRQSWDAILANNLTFDARNHRGADQVLLTGHVWPWAYNVSVQHDSYHCKYFGNAFGVDSSDNVLGFPIERRQEENNFVGSVVNEKSIFWEECPVECRRKEHPEWIHC